MPLSLLSLMGLTRISPNVNIFFYCSFCIKNFIVRYIREYVHYVTVLSIDCGVQLPEDGQHGYIEMQSLISRPRVEHSDQFTARRCLKGNL